MTSFLAPGLKQALGVVISAAALFALAAPAFAAQCEPRERIVQHLASGYNEKPVAMGLSARGSLVMIFASPAGTWTAVGVSAEGSACILDVGDGWAGEPPTSVVAQAD